MNNKGQMMGFGFIMGIVMLVVAVLLITSFWPTIQDSFDEIAIGSNKPILLDDITNKTVCFGVKTPRIFISLFS